MVTIQHIKKGEVLAAIEGDTLRGANLENACLVWANLAGQDLRGANLRGANLCWADISHANLTEANLEGADLTASKAHTACLAQVSGVTARFLGANMQNADLRGANLGRTLWEFANLSGVNAESTLFSLSDFTEANFTEGCFSGADFTGCHFVRVEAAKANFRFATLAQAVLRDSGFTLTDFGGADFTLAYLHRLRLQEAVLNDTLLLNTAFLECEDLHQAVGLEEVSVNSKVLLELKTLRANGAKLPEAFLLSAGISATEAKAFYS